MSAPRKASEVKLLEEKFKLAKSAILTDFRGLTVRDVTALRNLLRKSQIDYRVVKNRLAKLAIKETPCSELDRLLSGPTAIAFSYDDPVTSTKLLSQFMRSATNLDIKGGVIEGRLHGKEEILAIAELAPREVLLSQVLGMLASPLSGLARVLAGPVQKLMGTLDAIKERKEKAS